MWLKNWLEFEWVKNLIDFCRLSIDSKHKALILIFWFGPESLRSLWSVEVDCMLSCQDSTKRTEDTHLYGYVLLDSLKVVYHHIVCPRRCRESWPLLKRDRQLRNAKYTVYISVVERKLILQGELTLKLWLTVLLSCTKSWWFSHDS